MEILENGILLSIEEFDDLNHEIEYQKKTTELFHKENIILKEEFHKLEKRVRDLQEFKQQITEALKEKTETLTKGVVSSE